MTFLEYVQEELNNDLNLYKEMDIDDNSIEYPIEVDYTTQE